MVNAGSGDLYLRVDVYDGDTGVQVGSADYVLPLGGWTQVGSVLKPFGITNGYARITRSGGNGPFLAYGVLNDGATPGTGTGDGSYVPMAVAR
jgi:hypothetical protein